MSKKAEILEIKKLVEILSNLDKNSKRRNFKQSYEIIINLKDFDIKKEGGKFNYIIKLPNFVDEKVKICVIGERDIVSAAQEAKADTILRRSDIEKIQGNKRELKKLAQRHKFFLVQADLMPLVGKILGPYLGTRGKFPEVIKPGTDLRNLINNLRQSVRIRIKNVPVISCKIGKEGMDYKEIAENALEVIRNVENILAEKGGRIKDIYIKKTMSEPVKVI